MKQFFVSDSGEVSKHKIRSTVIIGMGIIHPDQELVVYTNKSTYRFDYKQVRVGGHNKRALFYRAQNELATKIDIVTKKEVPDAIQK